MTNNTQLIQSDRLDLILVTPAFLAASLASNANAATALINVTIPPEWLTERAFMQRRLRQVQDDPIYQPWMPRAICLRRRGLMIGHIGFHTQPGAAYLHDYAPQGVELAIPSLHPFANRAMPPKPALPSCSGQQRHTKCNTLCFRLAQRIRLPCALPSTLAFRKWGRRSMKWMGQKIFSFAR